MRIPFLVLAIGILVVEATYTQLEDQEAIENADHACSDYPSFSKDCAMPMQLSYFDQRSKACKSRKMCPPAEYGNAFATEENCNALCVDNPDEEPKAKAERIIGAKFQFNIGDFEIGFGGHLGRPKRPLPPYDPRHPANDPKHPANDPEHPANDPKHPANDPEHPANDPRPYP